MENNLKKTRQLEIILFPFMAKGHTIPTIEMAKLLSSHNIKTSIITTPLNAPFITNSLPAISPIEIIIVEFPSPQPENLDSASKSPQSFNNFFKSLSLLQPQIDLILDRRRPDCFIADTFFPWATSAAAKFGIPRVVFHGTCFFALCAAASLIAHQPYKNVSSDFEQFVIPDLPDEIRLTRSQVPGFLKEEIETDFIKVYRESKEVDSRSYGVLVNSFYELESAYADYYRNVLGKKAWHIGPFSLFKEKEAKQDSFEFTNEYECLKWLDSKQPESVIFVSFGTLASLNNSQLLEIAIGLERYGGNFIWVVKKVSYNEEEEEWLPEGFEKRVEGRGLIIRGWAPQVMILDHDSVGGFLTHCGWNSALEGISAGLPMVTWPNSAEQFYNEKLITDVLKIGVGVGALYWGRAVKENIKSQAIEKAVTRVMVGKDGVEMRTRAKRLGVQAREAIEGGGSSSSDLNAFFEDLRSRI